MVQFFHNNNNNNNPVASEQQVRHIQMLKKEDRLLAEKI